MPRTIERAELYKTMADIFGKELMKPFLKLEPRAAHWMAYAELNKVRLQTNIHPINKRALELFFKSIMKANEMLMLNKNYTFPAPPKLEYDENSPPMALEEFERWVERM